MRYSFYLNPQTPGPGADQRILANLVTIAEEAAAGGYDALCLTEHHFINYNTYGNAFMLGSFLAARVPDTTIITTVTVPGLQHPVELAERINLLENLTRGQCIIGIGTGGSPVEFAGFGRHPGDKRDLMFEVMGVVETLRGRTGEEPPTSYSTKFTAGEVRGRIIPSPRSVPGPLFARATVDLSSMVDAGRRGWGLITGRLMPDEIAERWTAYEDALRVAGHDAAHIERCLDWSVLQKLVHVAETDEQALAEVTPLLDMMDGVIQRSSPGDVPTEANSERLTVEMRGNREEFIRRAMIIGSPDTVRAQLQEYVDAGVRNFCTWMWFGDGPLDQVRRSMKLFAEEVAPNVAEPTRVAGR